MKTLLLLTLGTILVATALSCSQGGARTVFNEMKEAGCRADTQEFFSHVDIDAVRNNFTKDNITKIREGAYEDMLSERAMELSPKEWERMASDFVEHVRDQYEEEVKKGKTGKICRMQIISSKRNTLSVKMQGDPDIIWVFSKSGGALKLVEVY